MLLLLLACAAHTPAGPPGASSAVASAPSAASPDAPATAAVPAALAPLDEAGLVELLANPGPELLVVNFWATWCEPCVRELADLRAVATDRADVRFALVNVEGPRTRDAVLRFLATRGGGLPAFQLDTDDASAMLSRAVPAWPEIIPVTLVIDPGGAIRARFDGVMEAPALRAALAP